MQDQLMSFIESLKGNRRIISFDEAATKQAVVLKLLSLLSWDTFNIDEVTPEYSVGGRRIDYSLRINNANKVSMANTKKEMLDAYSTLLKQPRGKSESQNYIISISSLKNLSG